MLPSNLIEEDDFNLVNPNIIEKINILTNFVNSKMAQIDNMSDLELLCEDVRLKYLLSDCKKFKKFCINCMQKPVKRSANIERHDNMFKNAENMQEFLDMVENIKMPNNSIIDLFIQLTGTKFQYNDIYGLHYKIDNYIFVNLENSNRRSWINSKDNYKVDYLIDESLNIEYKNYIKIYAKNNNVTIDINNKKYVYNLFVSNHVIENTYEITAGEQKISLIINGERIFFYSYMRKKDSYDYTFYFHIDKDMHKGLNDNTVIIKKKKKRITYNIKKTNVLLEELLIDFDIYYEGYRQKYRLENNSNNKIEKYILFKYDDNKNKLFYKATFVDNTINIIINGKSVKYICNKENIYVPVNRNLRQHKIFGKSFKNKLLLTLDSNYENLYELIK